MGVNKNNRSKLAAGASAAGLLLIRLLFEYDHFSKHSDVDKVVCFSPFNESLPKPERSARLSYHPPQVFGAAQEQKLTNRNSVSELHPRFPRQLFFNSFRQDYRFALTIRPL